MKICTLSLLLALLTSGLVFLLSCTADPSSAALPSSPKTSLQINQALIPAGQYGRKRTRKMSPRYITIHSTQNYAVGANARTHARLLQRGGLTSQHNSLGYLTWHFTVDAFSIYQSLPTNEQGQHADYEGPGNRSSIGIEMCQNRDHSQEAILDRTARLTAQLMRQHRIPIQNVVPHQHWRMIRYSDKRDLGNKNCPNFLMTNGQPGPKWQAFLKRIERYL